MTRVFVTLMSRPPRGQARRVGALTAGGAPTTCIGDDGRDFPDAAHGWATGDYDGIILATTDGGATWTQQIAGTSEYIESVTFVDATHGWVVGYPGSILATTTGGKRPPVPRVTGFTPTSGLVGTPVTLIGTGFNGATTVSFNGTAATFSVASDTQMTATVPVGATSGPIAVTTTGGTGTSTASFAVTAPAKPIITKLSPTSGKRKATITIAGTGFSMARGTSFARFGSKKCSSYLFWSDTKIICKVPATAVYGSLQVKVTTTAGTSNGKSFKAKR